RSEAALDEWVTEATRAGTVGLALETEGTGADETSLVGLSLALLEGPWGNVNSQRRRAAYLPIGHRASGSGCAQGTPSETQSALDLGGNGGAKLRLDQLALKTGLAKLKPLLEDASILKVGENLKSDMWVLERHGIRIGPVDDTMLLSFVLDGGKHSHTVD